MQASPTSKAKRNRSTPRPQRTQPGRRLSANMEDYLEAIYTLAEETGVSRVSSIAETLGVKRPSVSKALKRLQREGLVTHTPYGGAAVTVRGKQVAQAQVRSHRALTRFLEQVLALSPQLAQHDACLMEHAISHETVERLVRFIDFLERNGASVTSGFRTSLTAAGETTSAEKPRRKGGGRDGAASAGPGRVWTSRV